MVVVAVLMGGAAGCVARCCGISSVNTNDGRCSLLRNVYTAQWVLPCVSTLILHTVVPALYCKCCFASAVPRSTASALLPCAASALLHCAASAALHSALSKDGMNSGLRHNSGPLRANHCCVTVSEMIVLAVQRDMHL
ncbi:hypothetical protein COO60DRAFT_1017324 [Scenedesmus sp. NREL 46B-D3]|nr:hypothetical protein COO60DRAFT_1017324 [Scenedesmus sp. NREL 46B-D3]